MPFELCSFTSLPSLHCKIELNCLSFSSAGHLALWPCSAANEGIDYHAEEAVAARALGASSGAGAAGSEGGSEVAGPEVVSTPWS